MLSKPFFGYTKPTFRYEQLSAGLPKPVLLAIPKNATLLLPGETGRSKSEIIKIGAKVKTGQCLTWDHSTGCAVVSSVTGTITSISAQSGNYGQKNTAITINIEGPEEIDNQFQTVVKNLTLQNLCKYLSTTPGAPSLSKLLDKESPINTIVIYGGDTDLLVETSLYVLKCETEAINQGIKVIKEVAGIDNVIVVVPSSESFQNYDGHFQAEVKALPATYPAAQPLMILYQLTGKMLEQGQSLEDLGMLFLRAEAVASIGKAVNLQKVPVEKILTVVDKEGKKNLISARIGTPVKDIFKKLDIQVNGGDRIIFGGPMTGTAIYAVDQPIAPDTDAIMIQDHSQIIFSSDYPCVNCGECIRICPAKIQVHMLERFLEVGQYQEGADLYDLYSCVECGLCSMVCPSRIPILQYIKLAKFELARTNPAEEENE